MLVEAKDVVWGVTKVEMWGAVLVSKSVVHLDEGSESRLAVAATTRYSSLPGIRGCLRCSLSAREAWYCPPT